MTTTIVGNTTADPELRYTQTGKAVTSLTVAVSKRRKDETGNWVDGEPTFIRCNIWGKPAENVAASVFKGTRVIVTGELKESTWQTEQGEKRSRIELNAANIGIDLTFAPAPPQQATATGWAGAGAANSAPTTTSQGQAAWTAQQPPQGPQPGQQQMFSDEPPF